MSKKIITIVITIILMMLTDSCTTHTKYAPITPPMMITEVNVSKYVITFNNYRDQIELYDAKGKYQLGDTVVFTKQRTTR